MDLLVKDTAPSSLSDTGPITFRGDVVEMPRARLLILVQNAYYMADKLEHELVWCFLWRLFGINSTSAKNLAWVLRINPDDKIQNVKWRLK